MLRRVRVGGSDRASDSGGRLRAESSSIQVGKGVVEVPVFVRLDGLEEGNDSCRELFREVLRRDMRPLPQQNRTPQLSCVNLRDEGGETTVVQLVKQVQIPSRQLSVEGGAFPPEVLPEKGGEHLGVPEFVRRVSPEDLAKLAGDSISGLREGDTSLVLRPVVTLKPRLQREATLERHRRCSQRGRSKPERNGGCETAPVLGREDDSDPSG